MWHDATYPAVLLCYIISFIQVFGTVVHWQAARLEGNLALAHKAQVTPLSEVAENVLMEQKEVTGSHESLLLLFWLSF